jgi:hypothetical protein
MHPLFKCRVAKLADYPESPQFDVASRYAVRSSGN